MNSILIGHVWFNGRSNVGIVLGYNAVENKLKAWITTAVGMDEDDDIKHIMEWGSAFPVEEAKTLIEKHGTMRMSPVEIMNLILENEKISLDPEDGNNG